MIRQKMARHGVQVLGVVGPAMPFDGLRQHTGLRRFWLDAWRLQVKVNDLAPLQYHHILCPSQTKSAQPAVVDPAYIPSTYQVQTDEEGGAEYLPSLRETYKSGNLKENFGAQQPQRPAVAACSLALQGDKALAPLKLFYLNNTLFLWPQRPSRVAAGLYGRREVNSPSTVQECQKQISCLEMMQMLWTHWKWCAKRMHACGKRW